MTASSSKMRRRRRRPTVVASAILCLHMDWTVSAAAAAAASSSASTTTQSSAPARTQQLTEREIYERSRQLSRRNPLHGSFDGTNDSSRSSAGSNRPSITLPTAMGESALIDRQTSQIFWQGGPSALFYGTSVTLQSMGARHVRSTIMSLILLTAALSAAAANLRSVFDSLDVSGPWWKIASVLAKCTVILPSFDVWFIVVVVALYFIEAYFCSTRKYLANALIGPAAVEEYVESLRRSPPVAQWTVRCYHYERRKSLAWLAFLMDLWLGISNKKSDMEGENSQPNTSGDSFVNTNDAGASDQETGPSFLMKKVVTHMATTNYRCGDWTDETTASLWKRAWSPNRSAPFTKLSLCAVLLLANDKARSDYFTQQSNFVSMVLGEDQYSEFSTNILCHGFKSRILAVRPVRGAPTSKLFRLHLFWVFTCLGLTVPYRIWFTQHCDELRLAVIKEVFAPVKRSELPTTLSSLSRWFTRSKSDDIIAKSGEDNSESKISASFRSDFRKRMEELAIYQADEAEETLETAAMLQEDLSAANGNSLGNAAATINKTHSEANLDLPTAIVDYNMTQNSNETKRSAVNFTEALAPSNRTNSSESSPVSPASNAETTKNRDTSSQPSDGSFVDVEKGVS